VPGGDGLTVGLVVGTEAGPEDASLVPVDEAGDGGAVGGQVPEQDGLQVLCRRHPVGDGEAPVRRREAAGLAPGRALRPGRGHQRVRRRCADTGTQSHGGGSGPRRDVATRPMADAHEGDLHGARARAWVAARALLRERRAPATARAAPQAVATIRAAQVPVGGRRAPARGPARALALALRSQPPTTRTWGRRGVEAMTGSRVLPAQVTRRSATPRRRCIEPGGERHGTA
jgi:hypothetical protein